MLIIHVSGEKKMLSSSVKILIDLLSQQGVTVSALIHDPNSTIDKKGKDTANHQLSGAFLTIASLPGKSSILGRRNASLGKEQDIELMNYTDLLLVFGYAVNPTSPQLKVEKNGHMSLIEEQHNCDNIELIRLIKKVISGVND